MFKGIIILLISFYSNLNAQNIYIGARSGVSIPLIKFVPNGEISPFFYSLPLIEPSYTVFVGLSTTKLCYELGYAHLNLGLSIQAHSQGFVRIQAVSPLYKTYLLSIGKRFNLHDKKINFQWMAGINLNNVNRKYIGNFSYDPANISGLLTNYKDYTRTGLWPGIHLRLKATYERKHSVYFLDLLGNMGLFPYSYTYYKANIDGKPYYATIVNKGNVLNLTLGYAYKFNFSKRK